MKLAFTCLLCYLFTFFVAKLLGFGVFLLICVMIAIAYLTICQPWRQ